MRDVLISAAPDFKNRMYGLAVAAGAAVACYLGWRKRSVAGYYAKYSCYAAVVVGYSVVILPWMLVRAALFGRTASFPWLAVFPFELVGRHVFGLRLGFVQPAEEVGKRLVPGAVLVVNHQSCLDAFVAVHLWRTVGNLSIVAKEKITYFPPAGILGYLTMFTFVDRRKPGQALLRLSSSVVRNRSTATSTLIFPEGTRRHHPTDRELLPFKKGAFVAAIEAKVRTDCGFQIA